MEQHYRHEYKYMISASDAKMLCMRLPHFMKRDPHAGTNGCYTIRSLYFDDPTYAAFHEKAAGTDKRTKYRIRSYDYRNTLFRLEKKEKNGHLTRKTGQTLSMDQVLLLQSGEKLVPMEGLAEELRLKCTGNGLRPVVLVDYDRTAFVCAAGNTRITLDADLRTIPYCKDILGRTDAMLPVLEENQVILEVKFDDFLPGYLFLRTFQRPLWQYPSLLCALM